MISAGWVTSREMGELAQISGFSRCLSEGPRSLIYQEINKRNADKRSNNKQGESETTISQLGGEDEMITCWKQLSQGSSDPFAYLYASKDKKDKG